MKILHVINNLSSGGAEKLLVDILPELGKQNVTVGLLLLSNESSVYHDKLIEKGIKIYVLKYNDLYDFRNIFEIRKIVIENKYDIVHSHTFPSQYWVGLSTLFSKGVSYVTTEHSTYNRRRDKKVFRFIDKIIYRRYDKIISISEETQDNLIKWLNLKKTTKFIVVTNGVNLDFYKQAKAISMDNILNSNKNDNRIVCMVGRFDSAKDQRTVIQAMKLLPDTIHLVLVGEGKLKTECEKISEKIGVSERVHFLGFRSDVERILKSVDIVVLSSKWEGFGLAAVEGMAAGKPVIISNVEGLNKVVDEEKLQFSVGDTEELALKIKDLIESNEKYSEMKNYVKLRVQRFDIKNQIQELIKIYNELK